MRSTDLTVRRATGADLDTVLALDRLTPVGHERTALLTSRVHSGDVLIAERSGRASAYVVVRPRSFFGRDFIELMAVSPRDRRQGIGTRLLRDVVREASPARVFTSTNESNVAMTRLLEKEGWVRSGRLVGIDEGDPELVYYTDSD